MRSRKDTAWKKNRKLGLSIKAREIDEDKSAMEQFGSTESGASLGDILGAALQSGDSDDAKPAKEEAKEKKATKAKKTTKAKAEKPAEDAKEEKAEKEEKPKKKAAAKKKKADEKDAE